MSIFIMTKSAACGSRTRQSFYAESDLKKLKQKPDKANEVKRSVMADMPGILQEFTFSFCYMGRTFLRLSKRSTSTRQLKLSLKLSLLFIVELVTVLKINSTTIFGGNCRIYLRTLYSPSLTKIRCFYIEVGQ